MRQPGSSCARRASSGAVVRPEAARRRPGPPWRASRPSLPAQKVEDLAFETTRAVSRRGEGDGPSPSGKCRSRPISVRGVDEAARRLAVARLGCRHPFDAQAVEHGSSNCLRLLHGIFARGLAPPPAALLQRAGERAPGLGKEAPDAVTQLS
jgi:hypothetical protein